MQLASRALILFAINDNPYADEADGGTHWTLLAYTRSDCTFSHYDSGHSDSNDAAARGIAAKLAPVLGYDMCNAVMYTSAVADMFIRTGPTNCRAVSCRAGYSFTTPHVPKQCNGYDCGMHVLGEYTINSAVAQRHIQQMPRSLRAAGVPQLTLSCTMRSNSRSALQGNARPQHHQQFQSAVTDPPAQLANSCRQAKG